MRTWTLFFLALSAAHGLQADPRAGIQVVFEPTVCRTGDLVELQATYTGPEYAEIELQLPLPEDLFLFSAQRYPVVLEHGRYIQRLTWLLQPLRPGTIELDAFEARLVTQGGATTVPIAPLRLEVSGYGAINDDAVLEPLNLKENRGQGGAAVVLWMGLLVGAGVVGFGAHRLRVRRRAPCCVEADEATDALGQLQDALEQGDIPVALIERVLVDRDASLSAVLRYRLEEAIYAKRADATALLEILRKEGA